MESDMTKRTFRVLRSHRGDRFYAVGETREADPNEVKHLLGRVLEEVEEPAAEKADRLPKNKAKGAAPANKAEGKGEGAAE
jgi:hypothetical protein